MPKVDLRANESQEQLLRRFNKSVVKSKVLADVRRKRWFVSKSELKRIEKKKATRRQRKAQRMQGSSSTTSSTSSNSNSNSSGNNSGNSRTQQ
jgi:small subunit ribosomal protein S21